MTQYVKSKFSYDDIIIKKTDKITCGSIFSLNWYNRTKNKIALFADKDDKYKEKNPKETVKQLRKKKLCLKQEVNKQKIC